MKKNKLLKLNAGILISLSLITFFPQVANAEWKQDSKGWWYTEGNSYALGWREIDGNWYYFYDNGYMATCDKIDGYFVNSNGAWTNLITSDEAQKLILNQDSEFINETQVDKWELVYNENIKARGVNYDDVVKAKGLMYEGEKRTSSFTTWNIPDEDGYVFSLDVDAEPFMYIVGKESKNVYALGNQGQEYAYEIQNNKVIKKFNCINNKNSYNWR